MEKPNTIDNIYDAIVQNTYSTDEAVFTKALLSFKSYLTVNFPLAEYSMNDEDDFLCYVPLGPVASAAYCLRRDQSGNIVMITEICGPDDCWTSAILVAGSEETFSEAEHI